MKPVQCPKCGGEDGYFERLIMHGEQHHTWDGNEVDWAQGNTYGGKRKYCADCGKDVTKFVESLKEVTP